MIRLITLFALFLSTAVAGRADIIYVDQAATGASTGLSWTDAFIDIQDALDKCAVTPAVTDTVCITSGVYSAGPLDTDWYLVKDNCSIVGGYVSGDNWRRPTSGTLTTIQGDRPGAALEAEFGFVSVDHTLLLKRLIITNTALYPSSASVASLGSGLNFSSQNRADSLTILDCVFSNCHHYGTPFAGGSAVAVSGHKNVTINRSSFVNCSGIDFGGALRILNPPVSGAASSIRIQNSAFIDNECIPNPSGSGGSSGGGMFANVDTTTIELINCSFVGNQAVSLGGGLYLYNTNGDTNSLIQFCTFSSNVVTSMASVGGIGAAYYTTNANCDIRRRDSIAYGNISLRFPTTTLGQAAGFGSIGDINETTYCCIQGTPLAFGAGNTNTDPLFISATNLRLQSTSPARNTTSGLMPPDSLDQDGDFDILEDLPYDQDDMPRVDDPLTGADKGCYEVQ